MNMMKHALLLGLLYSVGAVAAESIFAEPSLHRATSLCTIQRLSNLKNRLPISTHKEQNIILEDGTMEECHRLARAAVGKKHVFLRGVNGILGKENRLVTEARYEFNGIKFTMEGSVKLK